MKDVDECREYDPETLCGTNSLCVNTNGSFYCTCEEGYATMPPMDKFDGDAGKTCTGKENQIA